jgi:hypothetical protein
MEENFHLYQEVQSLPPADRDALFQILWEAQAGDTAALKAIYDLIYEDKPADMEEFVLGRRYLNLKNLINPEKVDLLVRFSQPNLRKMWIAAGSGAGKSFMVSICMAWVIHCLMCLRRPDLYYLLGPGSKIAVVNLSVSKEQARDVIFSEFIGRLAESPWFKGKYKAWTSRARFPKRVYAISGGSNAISFYGYHTIMGSVDEASFMVDKQDRSIAEELVEALLKSLNTRFPRSYKLFVISTLKSADDFLYTQIEKIKEEGVPVLLTPMTETMEV